MYCIQCGKEIQDSARFCDYCGGAQPAAQEVLLGNFCIHCGKLLPDGSDFCIHCGKEQHPTDTFDGEYCLFCGKKLTQGSAFCLFCGKSQVPQAETQEAEAFCLYCGKPLEKDSKFCLFCGKAQDQAPAPEPPGETYCLYCGKPIGEGSMFCLHCGRQQVVHSGPTPPIGPVTVQPPAKKSLTRDQILWIIIGSAVAFFVMVVMLFAVSCSGRCNSYNSYDSYTPAPDYSFDSESSSSRDDSSFSGSSSWEDDDDDDDFEVAPAPDYSARNPCPYCNNGRCDKCGGDGYLHSSASDEEDRNCTGAYCSMGRCTYCGGDGWRD